VARDLLLLHSVQTSFGAIEEALKMPVKVKLSLSHHEDVWGASYLQLLTSFWFGLFLIREMEEVRFYEMSPDVHRTT
jgi:hypothetical protein